MDAGFYKSILYPFQDQVLAVMQTLETGFYLTGGTALSRGYLQHRFSDDLDFFVNDDDKFALWADRVIAGLQRKPEWETQIMLREQRYVRLNLSLASTNLKIEMINDVPSRIGTPANHPVLGLLDTPENILANKVTALLDREEPKDLADIWGLCTKLNLSMQEAITNAQGKAAGVFPADLARLLCSATQEDWQLIRWQSPAPSVEVFLSKLTDLGEKLLLIN